MRHVLYDLETDGVNPEICTPTLGGFLVWETGQEPEYVWTSNINEMAMLLNQANVVIGWNNEGFDNVIMKRFGVSFYGKTIIDLMPVIHGKHFGNGVGRNAIMFTPEGKPLNKACRTKKLADTTIALGGPHKIGDFDYSLFKKPFGILSKEQQDEALEYLEADINATKYIFDYTDKFFEFFRDGSLSLPWGERYFLTDEQRQKFSHINASTASLVYKALCNLCDLPEKYAQNVETQHFGGGFVADPEVETAKGKIYCLDYNSLYPHIMMQANLYQKGGWSGTGISTTVGSYDGNNMGRVAECLKLLYAERQRLKGIGDKREYTIKIIINTMYGLLGNPVFASVADYTAAEDCTKLGQQWVKAARLHFKENGYKTLYTDTDSVYVLDPFNDKKRLLDCKDKHIADIKKSVPFPQDTFDMGVDDEIKFIAFSKKEDRLLKKNYLYVTNAGKLKIKGLKIIKSNCTRLSRKIFDTFIKSEIIDNSKHKFQKSQFEKWIYDLLSVDKTLASVFYRVKSAQSYAISSQIQAMIANHPLYGEGSHQFIKTRERHPKGAGVDGTYVGVQFADEIRLTQIDFDVVWSELEPFIEETQKTLFNF